MIFFSQTQTYVSLRKTIVIYIFGSYALFEDAIDALFSLTTLRIIRVMLKRKVTFKKSGSDQKKKLILKLQIYDKKIINYDKNIDIL